MQAPSSHGYDSGQIEQRIRSLVDGRLLHRLNYLWLAAILAILVTGNAQAHRRHPDYLQSWQGMAMLTLCVAFLGCYLVLIVANPRAKRWAGSGDSAPATRLRMAVLVCAFAVAAGLIGLEPSFGGLTYALMGTSMFLPFRAAMGAVSVAVLLDAWSMGMLPPAAGQTWSDTAGGVFAIAITVALVFAIAALIRTNVQRSRLIEDLGEAHRQLRLAADQEAELATMRERNRLAREMHDSLGHALVSIAVKLEAVRLLFPVDAARATSELRATTSLVRATMTELRHSLAGLRPVALDGQPLAVALAEMTCDLAQRIGITAEHNIDVLVASLDWNVQEALYRVSQEALTNVAKHAQAQHVRLSLAVHDGAAVLEVFDDGIGLDAAERTRSPGQGLRGMRERIAALGGTLSLCPRDDRGTVLRAHIPAKEFAASSSLR